MSGNSLYYVQITDPTSGKLRIFYLYDGISTDELNNLFQASFDSTLIAKGYTDESGVLYPPSMLSLNPRLFGGRKLYAVTETSSATISPTAPTIGIDSQDTLITEEQVKRAFELLDMNADNVIHKEEFIEGLTVAFINLFELDPGLAFAYTLIGSKDLAVITATSCYRNVSGKDTYYLSFDDFCAWYMSAGFDPLRELTIKAVELLSSHRLSGVEEINGSNNNHHLHRSKSRSHLDLSQCYRDIKIHAFINQMNSSFSLPSDALDQLAQVFTTAGKYSMIVSIRTSRSLIIDTLEYNDSAGFLLNIIYDMLDPTQSGSISLAHLLSLFLLSSPDAASSTIFETLFHYYREPVVLSSSSNKFSQNINHKDFQNLVNDLILLNHLSVVFRVIFYFNREYEKVTGCTAEQFSHGLYLKLLLSVEVQRRRWGKLSLSEFIELFLHGLHLGLSILQIREGYFYDLLATMLGYFPVANRLFTMDSNTTATAPANGKVGNEEADDDTDSNENILLKTNSAEDLEDQIAAYTVGYNGAAITIAEANEVLGLHEYSTYDLIKYFIQLTNKNGLISIAAFNRGILKLIGDHYISLTVLQRSIVDFILDQITKIFALPNPEQLFSLLELSMVLLLFCDDDTFTRAEIILALIRPKVIRFDIVYTVVYSLYKACYLLHPQKTVQEIEAEAEKQAKALCVEFYMEMVSPQINPLRREKKEQKNSRKKANGAEEDDEDDDSYDESVFTNSQFLKLLNVVFSRLEEESEQRKLESGFMDNDDQGNHQNANDSENQSLNESGRDSIGAFSEDEESDGLHLFLDDDRFPPSSTVLELRGAVSILGLEYYRADDLIDKLGSHCSGGGRLSAEGWSKWFAKVLQDAKISSFDMDLAINLGNKIFAAFQHENEDDSIDYVELAMGLSFLCTKTPLEERLMVAFTIADRDSDGFITFEEFVMLIRSTISIISVCSRLITKKILGIETSIEELARAAALEGIGALGIKEEDEISLEMLCDLAEDYLKLAALV